MSLTWYSIYTCYLLAKYDFGDNFGIWFLRVTWRRRGFIKSWLICTKWYLTSVFVPAKSNIVGKGREKHVKNFRTLCITLQKWNLGKPKGYLRSRERVEILHTFVWYQITIIFEHEPLLNFENRATSNWIIIPTKKEKWVLGKLMFSCSPNIILTSNKTSELFFYTGFRDYVAGFQGKLEKMCGPLPFLHKKFIELNSFQ